MAAVHSVTISNLTTAFNLKSQDEQDNGVVSKLQADIDALDTRIDNGRKWLDSHKGDEAYDKQEKRYYDLIQERASKIATRENRKEIKAVVVQLPGNIHYQPKQSKIAHSVLRVMFNGEAVEDNEVTLDGFVEFMKEIKWIKELIPLKVA